MALYASPIIENILSKMKLEMNNSQTKTKEHFFQIDWYCKAEKKIESIVEQKYKRNLIWGCVLFLFFVLLLLLNIFTPMTADDFGYRYIHNTNTLIGSFADIIQSQKNHYKLWGGRSVVHAIAEGLLLLPPMVVDILNTLVYLLFSILVYLLIRGKEANSIVLYLLVNLAVWFVQPAFGDTILWITGSANYLWGTTLILLFLLPFRFYEGKTRGMGITIFCSIFFFCFGIIAGWTNENTAGAMLCIVLLFFVAYRSQKWHIPLWGICGFIGALIGYIIMIVAPGNAARAAEAGELSAFRIVYRLLMHSYTLFTQYGILILVYAVLLIVIRCYPKNGNGKKEILLSCIFLLGALASVYAMIFSPSFPDRAWFGSLTYFIIALGILFANINTSELYIKQIRAAILAVGILSFAFLYYGAANDVHRFYGMYTQRELEVAQAKRDGTKAIVFERYVASTKFVHTEEPLSKFLIGRYYGVSVDFKESSVE